MTARDDLAISALAQALVRTGMYVDAGIDTSAGLDKPQVYAAAILNDPDMAADGLHFVMVETLERAERAALAAPAPEVDGLTHACPMCGDVHLPLTDAERALLREQRAARLSSEDRPDTDRGGA